MVIIFGNHHYHLHTPVTSSISIYKLCKVNRNVREVNENYFNNL